MVNMKLLLVVMTMMVGLSLQRCEDALGQQDDGCVTLICENGNSRPHPDQILGKCKQCQGWGDPHFEVFNTARFIWNAGGKYALVQNGLSENPDFGVFMEFTQTQSGSNAFVGTTTYQDNRSYKVELFPTPLDTATSKLFHVKVNGVDKVITLSTPTLLPGTTIFAWKHSSVSSEHRIETTSCVRLYGRSKILVELCESKITIWAPLELTLGGFCGSTDSTALREKKLVARGGTKHSNPNNWNNLPDLPFGNSWKVTSKRKRRRSLRKLRSVEIEHEKLHRYCVNHVNSENITDHLHHKMCLGVHKVGNGGTEGDDHLDACKYDLCVVAYGAEHKSANFTIHNMLESHVEIHARTKIHREHTIEIVPDESKCLIGFNPVGGKCYKFHEFNDSLTLMDAWQVCKDDKAALATPTNATAINNYIREVFPELMKTDRIALRKFVGGVLPEDIGHDLRNFKDHLTAHLTAINNYIETRINGSVKATYLAALSTFINEDFLVGPYWFGTPIRMQEWHVGGGKVPFDRFVIGDPNHIRELNACLQLPGDPECIKPELYICESDPCQDSGAQSCPDKSDFIVEEYTCRESGADNCPRAYELLAEHCEPTDVDLLNLMKEHCSRSCRFCDRL